MRGHVAQQAKMETYTRTSSCHSPQDTEHFFRPGSGAVGGREGKTTSSGITLQGRKQPAGELIINKEPQVEGGQVEEEERDLVY